MNYRLPLLSYSATKYQSLALNHPLLKKWMIPPFVLKRKVCAGERQLEQSHLLAQLPKQVIAERKDNSLISVRC